MACIRGLTSFAEILFNNAAKIPKFEEYFPAPLYHAAIAGILKQGVERLDNVRQMAGEHLRRLLLLPLPPIEDPSPWQIEGYEMMTTLFLKYVSPPFSSSGTNIEMRILVMSIMKDGRMATGYFPEQ